MNKKAEILSDKSVDIIVTIYFFLSGIFTLNFLQSSISAYASGTAFLIAGVYGAVSVCKGTKFFA